MYMSVKMPPKPKFSHSLLIYLLIATAILTILLFSDGVGMVEYKIEGYVQLFAIFDVIPLTIYLFFFIPQCRKYILAKTNYEKYEKEEEERLKRQYYQRLKDQAEGKARKEQIENERQIAIASQSSTSPWAVK